MKDFIELIDDNGKFVSINRNQITSFSPSGEGTHIYLTGTIQRDIQVQEKYQDVKKLVSFSIHDDK